MASEQEVIPAMEFRHEWKIQLNYADYLTIRQRLRAVAAPDPHTPDGTYQIRSLYFDTPGDRALMEKLNGVNRREKFRIRCYNGCTDLIHLEKKSKVDGLCSKQSTDLTPQQAQALVDGETAWMLRTSQPLVQELYCKMQNGLLRPKTIVDYTRDAFVYGPGNVRVTLDYDLRTGIGGTDFLNPHCATVPVPDCPLLMEVKWDAFLPDPIRAAVQLPGRRASAFSKYAACRVYG